ncbi:MAG: hypothetical protein WCP22_03235 [Chlamydiota bacterium]
MNTLEKCDEMTELVLKIESVKNEKAESNKEFNEELNQLDQKLLDVARERTDQVEMGFMRAAGGKDKGAKRAAGE